MDKDPNGEWIINDRQDFRDEDDQREEHGKTVGHGGREYTTSSSMNTNGL